MTTLTVEQYERMNELYDEAVSRYLNKTDFNISDWLSEDEAEEYESLREADEGGL